MVLTGSPTLPGPELAGEGEIGRRAEGVGCSVLIGRTWVPCSVPEELKECQLLHRAEGDSG